MCVGSKKLKGQVIHTMKHFYCCKNCEKLCHKVLIKCRRLLRYMSHIANINFCFGIETFLKRNSKASFKDSIDLRFFCDVLKNLSILLAPNHIIHIFFSLPCLGNTSFKRLNSSGLHWFVIASWIFVNSSLAAAFCCSILSLNKNVSERVQRFFDARQSCCM